MEQKISVIIPCYNSASTIGRCLEAVFASDYPDFEVIVADDQSSDGSGDIIRRFPCSLIRLDRHGGASKARNTGALQATGDVLFFIDADCMVFPDTLTLAARAFAEHGDALIGGTYTPIAADDTFFSTFQSVFVHYSETKKRKPDYVATHAMVIARALFEKSGGFAEDFLPILEDVEFSHRLRRKGHRLVMVPELQVGHVFNFTLSSSMRNAFRKSFYWVIYSLTAKDLLKDSGTASAELKVDVMAWSLSLPCVLAALVFRRPECLLPVAALLCLNVWISRSLFGLFLQAKGPVYCLRAVLYYTIIYPLPVAVGSLAGMTTHLLDYRKRKMKQ